MKKNHLIWLFLTAGSLLVLFVWHGWLGHTAHVSMGWMQLSHAVGYVVFALLCLGTFARLRAGHPAVWRMLTVLAGSLLAAGEIKLHGYAQELFLPLWAASLIGMSMVSVAARVLPGGILKVWLDLENKA